MKIAVLSRKGGVGKTTTTAYIARLLANYGRTLTVDADPDGSLLAWLGAAGDLPFDVVSLPTPTLHQQIAGPAAAYQHLIIDGPPGKSDTAIMQAAALAAEIVVIPVSPTGLDLDRIHRTLDALAQVQNLGSFDIRLLLTKVRRGTRSAIETRELLREVKLPILEAEVPLSERYAGAFGQVPPEDDWYAAALLELVNGQ